MKGYLNEYQVIEGLEQLETVNISIFVFMSVFSAHTTECGY